METTVTGVFADRQAAQGAVQQLESAGFGKECIELIDQGTPDIHHKIGEETSDLAGGARVGAAVGGVGGVIAGAAQAAVFDAGPVVGALVGGAICAMAGAGIGVLIGSATGHQVQEEYEHVLERGGVLVAVNTDRNHASAANAVLARTGGSMLSTSTHRAHHTEQRASA